MNQFILKYIKEYTPEITRQVIDHSHNDGIYGYLWAAEATNLGYANRWLSGEKLPAAVRGWIVDWVRNNPDDFYKNNFEPLAKAIEANNPKMLLGEPKEEEMSI